MLHAGGFIRLIMKLAVVCILQFGEAVYRNMDVSRPKVAARVPLIKLSMQHVECTKCLRELGKLLETSSLVRSSRHFGSK